MTGDTLIRLENVSRFYGEVLGVNRVDLTIEPGVTGLVGPNGAGKSTLMNLLAGMLRPSRGRVLLVRGHDPDDCERFFRIVGYCTQYDSFPPGVTGWEFVFNTLRLHGFERGEATELCQRAIERVDLIDSASRRVDSYSKGMRQRIRLAQATCHDPSVLILDEPLNGLDPVARAQTIALFRDFADAGAHVLVSSHILHEVDLISDRVVLLDNGYIVAEGDVAGIQGETMQPMTVFVRCAEPQRLAARIFDEPSCTEARLHADGGGLFVQTTNADVFFERFNRWVVDEGWQIEAIGPADETVYRQLVVREPSIA